MVTIGRIPPHILPWNHPLREEVGMNGVSPFVPVDGSAGSLYKLKCLTLGITGTLDLDCFVHIYSGPIYPSRYA